MRDRLRSGKAWTFVMASVVAMVGGAVGASCSLGVPLTPTFARPIDQSRFRIVPFASGLANPTSMAELADGSLLVATSNGAQTWIANDLFGSTSGALVRLVDTDGDGVADGAPQVLASAGLPGLVTSVRRVGNLVVALSAQSGGPAITAWRTGATPSDPLTAAGKLSFSFPNGWEHTTYALAMRPAAAGGIEIYFNVGSKVNNAATSASETVGLSASGGASFVGTSGAVQMVGDSIQRVVVNDTGNSLTVAAPVPIATGLRNAAGMTFDGAGNLWFEDNGIDNPANLSASLSADTLHVISASLLGVTVPNFGFAGSYVDYATGAMVGPLAGVTLPVADFRPIGGEKSEGAVELAFAPSSFPDDLAGGIFVPFSGAWNAGGPANTENPVLWVDPATGRSFHFIENQIMGHPNGVLATSSAIFLSDLNFTGAMVGTVDGIAADRGGVIYRITPLAVPEPSSAVTGLMAVACGIGIVRARSRRRLSVSARSR
jgi:glucose/arabinose dehydrogenase